MGWRTGSGEDRGWEGMGLGRRRLEEPCLGESFGEMEEVVGDGEGT